MQANLDQILVLYGHVGDLLGGLGVHFVHVFDELDRTKNILEVKRPRKRSEVFVRLPPGHPFGGVSAAFQEFFNLFLSQGLSILLIGAALLTVHPRNISAKKSSLAIDFG